MDIKASLLSLLGGTPDQEQEDNSPRGIFKKALDQAGGNSGEVFNESEMARKGMPTPIPALNNIPQQNQSAVNRYAQSYDNPITAMLAVPYEGMKGIEQKTGFPALSGPAKLLNRVGVPVAIPGRDTSPASWKNIQSSLGGAALKFDDTMQKLFGGFLR